MSAVPHERYQPDTVDRPTGLGGDRPQLHQIHLGRASTTTLQYCLVAALMTIAALLIFAPVGASASLIFTRIYSALGGT
jgi:hypothetical protein